MKTASCMLAIGLLIATITAHHAEAANGWCSGGKALFNNLVVRFRDNFATDNAPYDTALNNKAILVFFGSSNHPDRNAQYGSLLKLQSWYAWTDFLVVHVPIGGVSYGETQSDWTNVLNALASQNIFLTFPTLNLDTRSTYSPANTGYSQCGDAYDIPTGSWTSNPISAMEKILLDKAGNAYRRYSANTLAESIASELMTIGVTASAGNNVY